MPLQFPYGIDRTGRTATSRSEAEHVRQLIEQVLFTAPGERVNRPTLGTGVKQLVFEPGGEQMITAAQHLVRGALQQWLAEYIEIHDVDIEVTEGTVEVTLRYALRRTGEPRVETFMG
jgi:hypothetical protein